MSRSALRPGFRHRTSALLLVGLLTTTAACGGDSNDSDDADKGDDNSSTESGDGEDDEASDDFTDQPASDILNAAVDDMRNLQSTHMVGKFFNDDGQQTILDISMDNRGACAGTMSVEEAEAELIGGDQGSFIKGNEAFWDDASGPGTGERMLAQLGDKWAKMPDSEEGAFTSFCDLDAFLDGMESGEDSGGQTGEVSEIAGHEVIQLTGGTGGDEDSEFFVATGDQHYIVRMVSKDEDEPGQFDFSEFNEPVDVSPPSEGEYLDVSQLG